MMQKARMTVGNQEDEDEFIVTVSSYFWFYQFLLHSFFVPLTLSHTPGQPVGA